MRSIFQKKNHLLAGLLVVIFGIILAVFLSKRAAVVEAQTSGSSPSITGVQAKQVEATSTTINWTTDVKSDSVVNYGTTKNLGIGKDPNPSLTKHEAVLEDLEPATQYFFRVSSADDQGNRSFSPTFEFTTPGTVPIANISQVASPQQKLLTQKISESLNKVTDVKALEIIEAKVEEVGQGILSPPIILGEPRIDIGSDTATISWDTDKEANSIIDYASDSEYQSGGYAHKEEDAETYSLKHSITLLALKPETVYHFRITSKPQIGPDAQTRDKNFTTKSTLPQIFGVHLLNVGENTATLTWSTQVPAGGLVEYTNLSTRETKSIGDPSMQIGHTIRLPDLKFRTPYTATIKANTVTGDVIASPPVTFVTTKDDTPPLILNVANESTLYPGADVKVQTIVSWDTDKVSVCQVFYGAGLTVTDENKVALAIETGYVLKHTQVITDFSPSTVYKFWIECDDKNGNHSKSEDFVLYTPEQQKNIIDLILENFQGTFGWVNNIGK